MGGSQSHEFMVKSPAGEDWVVECPKCGYAANLEKAVSHPSPAQGPDPDGDLTPEEFHTPGRKTIAEVAEFTGLPETSQMKSLVMVADGQPVLALLRGDHQLSETKFAGALGAKEIRPAHPQEIVEWFGAEAGSLGPVGVTGMRILADLALQGRRNMIAGANKDDHHLRHVTPDEDFKPEYRDLRQVASGDACTGCGGELALDKTIEIGHIFKLGYRYSEGMGLRVLNAEGKEVAPIMGSYGIGIERILSSAVELYADSDGMALPVAIAPFHVVITPVNNADAAQMKAAREIYEGCRALGLDPLLDDRDERPGVKFKDADLIGIPYRITVGKKLARGMVELVERRGKLTSEVEVGAAAAAVSQKIESALQDGH
jgi:prolyl-tRNA synthetase